MAPSRRDYEFNNSRICHIMPKTVQLDRVLINLYMLLKHNGQRPVARSGRQEVSLDDMVQSLIGQHSDTLQGFSAHPDVVRDWLYSDLVDIVYRGYPDKEAVAAPMPLHLNAYKLRNPRLAKDYRASEHLFSMMHYADPTLPARLADYLGRGMDRSAYETYDGQTPLDIETLIIVRLVDNPNLRESKTSRSDYLDPPLCLGQARLMCDDIRRLLAYEHAVPRAVLISYLRTAFGLHLGLYLLRLFRQLTGWVRSQQAHAACLNCPVHPGSAQPFADCPYAFQNPRSDALAVVPEFVVDMGEDVDAHMAMLARQSCAQHYVSMNDYIRSVFTVNELIRFATSPTGQRQWGRQPTAVAEALSILAEPPEGLDYYFDMRTEDLFPRGTEDEERAEVRALWEMGDLAPIDRFIELLMLARMSYYRKYLIEQIDSVLMKNSDTCLLRQGKGRGARNERRWHIGSRLLEMLGQIAVLEPGGVGGETRFRSRPILIDGFVTWLRERYGLTFMPDWAQATIRDHTAFNANLQQLKQSLREIGFFVDLSDAYNAQTIRPRYPVETAVEGANS